MGRNDSIADLKKPGAKNDSGKLLYHLVDDTAHEALVAVLTLGAAKYSEDSWRSVEDAFERYDDALMRHRREFRRFLTRAKKLGLTRASELRKDRETQLPHTAQLLCNAMFLAALDIEMHDPDFNGTLAAQNAIGLWRRTMAEVAAAEVVGFTGKRKSGHFGGKASAKARKKRLEKT